MENQNIHYVNVTFRSIFNLSVVIFILLVGFSVFYYFVIFLPGKENTRIQQEDAKEKDRQSKITSCLGKAYESYRVKWNSICKLDGKEEDCTLLTTRSEPISDYYKELKDECYKRYPQ